MTTFLQGARLYREAAYVVTDVLTGEVTKVTGARRKRLQGFYPSARLAIDIAAMHAELGYAASIDAIDGRTALADFLDVALLQSAEPPELGGGIADEMRMSALMGITNTVGYYGWAYVFTDFLVPYTASEPVTERTAVGVIDPGWDAGAISANAVFTSGRARFRVQSGGDFIVGFLEGGDPLKPISRFIGIEFRDNFFGPSARRPFGDEGSINGHTVGGVTYYAPYYAEGHEFQIVLRQGVASYTGYAPDGTVTWSYDYSLPFEMGAPGVFNLGAAIYYPGTWVEALEFVQLVDVQTVFPAFTGRAGEGSPFSGANVTLPMLVTTSHKETRSETTLPAMKTAGGNPYSFALNEFPAMTTRGYSPGAIGNPPHTAVVLPMLQASGYSIVGTVGNSSGVLPAMRVRGTEGNLADSYTTLPALRTFASALPEGEGAFYSLLGADGELTGVQIILASLEGRIAGATTLSAAVLLDAIASSTVNGATTLSATEILEAVLNSTVFTNGMPEDAEAPHEVWVLNLANEASSSYESYEFNSFMTIDGKHYGVKDDGVFLLEGDTDDGVPIQASVSFGAQDFGSKSRKHMTRAYVGASSTGTLLLKITTGEGEYIYSARASSEELKQQRFDVGRGLQATHYTFELFNQDGADFDIDSVSFFAADFSRRI